MICVTPYMYVCVIAIVTAVACCLPGVFLLLHGVALMSDAISHAILLGIVLMFLFINSLHSPFMILGASLAGLAMVFCTEFLVQTNRLKKDAAIGLVFPLFFSLGVLLISLYARSVHLDVDMVLLGEIIFAPFNRFILFGYDVGPCALWSMTIILLCNTAMVWFFYHQLVVTTFDKVLSHMLGFAPSLVYYGLMTLTSITAVTAFDVVGSIVVVALMITPAAIGYLLAHRVERMISVAVCSAIISAVTGCIFAFWADVSVAGSIAAACGMLLLVALIFSPEKGVIFYFFTRARKTEYFIQLLIMLHLKDHRKVTCGELSSKFFWHIELVEKTVQKMVDKKYIMIENELLFATQHGHETFFQQM